MSRLNFRTLALIAATGLMSGCGSAQSSTPVNTVLPQNAGLAQTDAQSNTLAVALSTGSATYRHGLVPMLDTAGAQRASDLSIDLSTKTLHYRGGTGGVGVLTAKPNVYLVFWGSQWGTEGTDTNGYRTFSGDPHGMAPDLQAFFAGLGTNETWSGIVTQYCDRVAVGATSCPSANPETGWPTGGALAGAWEDTSSAAPASATGHQIGEEAVKAASHFGNRSETVNLRAVYIVVSPTGTNPDNYRGNGFCAWHDYTGDSTLDGGGSVSSPWGRLAFTNLPYVIDAGSGCGSGFVNPGNDLDGVTIVGGHEYAETLTDQFPAGGWTSNNGDELADLCAWVTSGAGRSQNLVLTTGTFAVQGLWSNRANNGNGACAIKQAQL